MCGGGGGTTKKKFPKVSPDPNPGATADTSNDYNAQRAIVATTDQQNQPTSFGSELGG